MERKHTGAGIPEPHEGPIVYLRGRLDEDWSTTYYLFRRAMAILFSLGVLACFMPLVLFLGFLIRLESNGPLFYRGRRVGKDGKVFTMFKLRTLRHGVESQIGVHLLQEDSDHFTRVGRLVRRTKLDEIPQFWNVIRGEMTIIGPRPVRPIRARLFLKTIPGFRQVLQVKPGISGLSQVVADYYDPAEKKFQYDLEYVRNRCLWLDLKLVFLTVIRVPIGAVRYFVGFFRSSVEESEESHAKTRERAEIHGPR
jgi:lipopolysaccharide/colanic/teichoic acid biosynthesis glycosyltransferase